MTKATGVSGSVDVVLVTYEKQNEFLSMTLWLFMNSVPSTIFNSSNPNDTTQSNVVQLTFFKTNDEWEANFAVSGVLKKTK